MPLSKIQGIDGQVTPNLGRRNLIINGAMQVAQRGVGPTEAGNGNYITVDRMQHWSYPSGAGRFTSTQSTGHQLNTGHDTALKIDVTTADASIGASDYYEILQRIEGKNLQHLRWGTAAAKKLQVSFWVRATKTGVNALFCSKQGTGTDYRNVVEFTINASDTWEHKTVEIPALTASTIANDASTYIQIGWVLAMGSSFQNGTAGTWTTQSFYTTANAVNHMDSTANDFYITGFQVEVGDTATDFEHRSFAEELQLCKRYFQILFDKGHQYHANAGFIYQTNSASTQVHFPVEMRTDPAATRVGTLENSSGGFVGASSWSIYYSGSWRGCSLCQTTDISANSMRLDFNAHSGMTNGGACGIYAGSGSYFELNAEI